MQPWERRFALDCLVNAGRASFPPSYTCGSSSNPLDLFYPFRLVVRLVLTDAAAESLGSRPGVYCVTFVTPDVALPPPVEVIVTCVG
jgi:hypothetical protein